MTRNALDSCSPSAHIAYIPGLKHLGFTLNSVSPRNESIDQPKEAEEERIVSLLKQELPRIAKLFPIAVLRQAIDLIESMEKTA